MTKPVLVFGGPGPASVIGQAILHAWAQGARDYEFRGFVNDAGVGSDIDGMPVIGAISDVPALLADGYDFLWSIYKIGGQGERIAKFRGLNIPSTRLATFVHPQAYVAPNSTLAPGCVVMPGASVSGNTKIGVGTLIMMGAVVGHDNNIGAHNFLTARSCLGSWIETGEGVWIGLNSTIRGRVKLGDRSAVGAGAVVTKDVGPEEIWVGNPARFHKRVGDEIRF